jgi:hypothetical protein
MLPARRLLIVAAALAILLAAAAPALAAPASAMPWCSATSTQRSAMERHMDGVMGKAAADRAEHAMDQACAGGSGVTWGPGMMRGTRFTTTTTGGSDWPAGTVVAVAALAAALAGGLAAFVVSRHRPAGTA